MQHYSTHEQDMDTELTPLKREANYYQCDNASGSEDLQPAGKQDAPNTCDKRILNIASYVLVASILLISGLATMARFKSPLPVPVLQSGAWSSKADPFSTVDPVSLGFKEVNRPLASRPGEILANLIDKKSLKGAPDTALPTNSWFQNLIIGDSNNELENKVFAIPYILDTAGYLPGVRTHGSHLEGHDNMVLMNYQPASGLTLGATETFLPQHHVHKHTHGTPFTISKLAIELEWVGKAWERSKGLKGSSMRSPIVRGSPYTSMKYMHATPHIFVERRLSIGYPVMVDQHLGKSDKTLTCGQGKGNFSHTPVTVQRELKMSFDTADMTWLMFVSEPTTFVCSEYVFDPLDGPMVVGDPLTNSYFELKAVKPMKLGMVRVAMGNNCTTGQNPEYCKDFKPRDQSDYEDLLRKHAEVYPTAKADIQFTFPIQSEEEEELRLNFDWQPAQMSALGAGGQDFIGSFAGGPAIELLMFAQPHHQERIRPTVSSTNEVIRVGCQRNLHGLACPVTGAGWSMVEHLHRTSFYAPRAPRTEMLPAIKKALQQDITYSPPENYMAGAGDTYFSGKMLSKLARILIVADEVGGVTADQFTGALDTLRSGVEVWLNGSAGSPFLYDRAWGGLVMCGCDYGFDDKKQKGYCKNKFPDCPALVDAGQNFGAGFYNDHHFHYGYHIYAAAVLAKFDARWGRKFHQHVLLLVRDIVNPSDSDKFFPTWRHKDWYLGFSWASGIVTQGGKPYPNGRNQESASESISGYEAVALYGDTMAQVFDGSPVEEDKALQQTALRIRDMGRLLMATEIRSTRMYWHVQAPGTEGVERVYPEVYRPKVVGMMWSMLVQLQTWFGNEEWKSYGIQLMPITPAAELRDDPAWMAEMLPHLAISCLSDADCWNSGWATTLYAILGSVGRWKQAWVGLERMDKTFFNDAGGNGQSLSNSLWYIATRPILTTDFEDTFEVDIDDDQAMPEGWKDTLLSV